MLIQVSGKGFEMSQELRGRVQERLDDALSHFSERIGRVRVYLADENGPKSGVDKSLRVVIDLKRLPMVVMEERGETWHSILDRATDRTFQTVGRLVERVRTRKDRGCMAGDGSRDPEMEACL